MTRLKLCLNAGKRDEKPARGGKMLALPAAIMIIASAFGNSAWAQNHFQAPEPAITFDENAEQDDEPLPEKQPRWRSPSDAAPPARSLRETAAPDADVPEQPRPRAKPNAESNRPQPLNSYDDGNNQDGYNQGGHSKNRYIEDDTNGYDDGYDNGYDDGDYYQQRGPFRFTMPWNPLANRLEVRAEWLLWWGAGDHVPALVTTSPAGTSRDLAGILGQSGTSVLFGDQDLNVDATSGMRFGLDYWLTRDRTVGVEVEYFGMAENSQSFSADSSAFPILARPFYNTTTSAADAGLIAYPDAQTGNVSVNATTNLTGVEALLRHALYRVNDAHIDFLAGYRYMRLSDNLDIAENETFIDPAGVVPVNSTIALTDHFGTVNEFNGADFGVVSDWTYGRLNLGLSMKVGVGNTNSRVSINGSTVATEPGQTPLVSSGGLLALNSNSGTFSRNQFTMLPEFGANLGFDLTPHIRLIGGYSLLYWGSVARAGDQIDTNLAQTQFPPAQVTSAQFPQFRFAMSDYWAQGISVGLAVHF